MRYVIREINTTNYLMHVYKGAGVTPDITEAYSWKQHSSALQNAKDLTFSRQIAATHNSMLGDPNYQGNGQAYDILTQAGPELTPMFELVEYDPSTNQVVSFKVVKTNIEEFKHRR